MKTKTILVVGLAVLIGIGAGFGFSRWLAPAAPTQSDGGERKPLYYRNPMNPDVTSKVPAKDNMGMDYVPVYADEAAGGGGVAGSVRVDPSTVQSFGVRTAEARLQAMTRDVFTVGRVDYDEKKLSRFHPKVEGWIERQPVDETGSVVARGTNLLELYSPVLVVSQEEYLLALRNRDALAASPYPEIARGAEQLAQSARQRLLLLDLPRAQVQRLEKTRQVAHAVPIQSPFDGIVVKVGAREGMYVTPQTELYVLADLSTVWVYADVYEYEMPWVAEGDLAQLQLASLPEQTFEGRVDFIYPYLDKATRTQKVRLAFANPGRLLKPEMYGDVSIRTGRQVDAVVIPEEAVIRSGRREQVFVLRSPGQYEPRPVTLGVSSDGMVQITGGLKAGEQVVVSGQFLIDSESKLREVSAKMQEPANTPEMPAGHDMSAMDDMAAPSETEKQP
ncbi:MAG: efflux transporter periplasmic adaptor subunit [Gammaproteobacteria bacterium HGW-Gammaproteobacteria-4]|jgi:Cu(I)/Ag(I) efflux system membrane fusion protein|nr:MAG: efflux transporter periplasmic adaptor subunit [Gammaproteobacteria bacterium HGW-Gammaproteobacteria-4]